jgi:hypothetical protein
MKSLFHPALGQDVNYTIQQVPEGGDSQTAAVIGMMSDYALADSSTPEIQRDAQQALAENPSKSISEAVFWYVKRRLRFVRDEETALAFQGDSDAQHGVIVEALIRPVDMSTMPVPRHGDCDDFSMYTASLLLALGVPVSFVTVAATPGNNDYSHVYVATYQNGVRVPLDTSHGDRPGWETPRAHRIKEWEVGGVGKVIGLAVLAAIGAWLLCQ